MAVCILAPLLTCIQYRVAMTFVSPASSCFNFNTSCEHSPKAVQWN